MKKIALVGYGYWGPNVAKNIYRNKNLEFAYICDKRQERLQLAKDIYAQSVNYTADYKDVIDDPSVDAVALAVETSAHYELAKAALLAGKDLYVEKPFTDNVQDALELKALAQERGLIIHVDHIMVYHPAIRKMKEIIDRGEIGDFIWIDCSRLNLGQVKNDVNSMWDLTVHDLAIVEYLTGGSKVKSVKAMGTKMYSSRYSITQLMVQYEDFFSSMRASWISPIKERKLIVAGTKKMIVYDDVDVVNKLVVYDKGFDVQEEMEYSQYVVKARNGDAYIPQLNVEDALYNSLEHFRNCMVTREQSMTDADAAIRVIDILERADESLDNLIKSPDNNEKPGGGILNEYLSAIMMNVISYVNAERMIRNEIY